MKQELNNWKKGSNYPEHNTERQRNGKQQRQVKRRGGQSKKTNFKYK